MAQNYLDLLLPDVNQLYFDNIPETNTANDVLMNQQSTIMQSRKTSISWQQRTTCTDRPSRNVHFRNKSSNKLFLVKCKFLLYIF